MIVSRHKLGSVLLEVNGNRLDAFLIDRSSFLLDYFSIFKGSEIPPLGSRGITATAVSTTQIDLTWNDRTILEDGFSIERSPDGEAWAEIDTVGADITAYQDGICTPDTRYWYRLRAFNGSGYSAYSSVDDATTFPCPPPPGSVGNTMTLAKTGFGFRVRWEDIAGATLYNLYRDFAEDGPYSTFVDSEGSGAVGIYRVFPDESPVFYKIAGANECYEGPK